MDLSIIIVNYNSSRLLQKCLESISASKIHIDYEVIVVDNNSTDGGIADLKKRFPQVNFIEQSVNRGFAAGNNAGIMNSTGEAILLVNPDAELEENAVQILYDELMSAADIGIVGPKIFYADDRLQSKVLPKNIPRLRDIFYELFLVGKICPHSTKINAYHGSDSFDYEKKQNLGQVSGACLMIKRKLADLIGLMDENYFLYYEETDWCYRANGQGYRIVWVPSAIMVHHEGGSSGNSKRSIYAYYESQLYFFKKNYGSLPAYLLYLVNIMGLVFRLLISPAYIVANRNMIKTKRFYWALAYHLNPKSFARTFTSR